MARRRVRRPGPRRRCRLESVAWLVDESRLVEIVSLARAAGFSVTVSPSVHVVEQGGQPAASPFGAEPAGPWGPIVSGPVPGS